jgi:hypothetical protein
MVTVANCYDLQEALRLQMALGAADIPSFIPDEATAQNAPYFFVGSGAGVRLQVAGEHVSEAQRIIATARGENDLVAVRRRPPKRVRAPLRRRHRQALAVCALVLLWLLFALLVRAEPDGLSWYAVVSGPFLIVLVVIIAPPAIYRLRRQRRKTRRPSGTHQI